jgi:hypothetical protein
MRIVAMSDRRRQVAFQALLCVALAFSTKSMADSESLPVQAYDQSAIGLRG